MGIRPLEYLMRQRLDRARYLLRTSKASIKEVTYNIGLRDPAYFSRVFLKYCHVSPSVYRTTCNA
jgi:two-component system response regulator YesN